MDMIALWWCMECRCGNSRGGKKANCVGWYSHDYIIFDLVTVWVESDEVRRLDMLDVGCLERQIINYNCNKNEKPMPPLMMYRHRMYCFCNLTSLSLSLWKWINELIRLKQWSTMMKTRSGRCGVFWFCAVLLCCRLQVGWRITRIDLFFGTVSGVRVVFMLCVVGHARTSCYRVRRPTYAVRYSRYECLTFKRSTDGGLRVWVSHTSPIGVLVEYNRIKGRNDRISSALDELTG